MHARSFFHRRRFIEADELFHRVNWNFLILCAVEEENVVGETRMRISNWNS
jgi:hypothetical protein